MKLLSFCLVPLALFFACCNSEKTDLKKADISTWRVKGGNAAGTQYSSLEQITKDNVTSLKLAWTYHSGFTPFKLPKFFTRSGI